MSIPGAVLIRHAGYGALRIQWGWAQGGSRLTLVQTASCTMMTGAIDGLRPGSGPKAGGCPSTGRPRSTSKQPASC